MITIIALHGNGGGAHRFARVAPLLQDGTRLEAVTLPGFGARPRDPELRSMRDFATYVDTIVAEVAAPVILLGHGIGGSIALEYVQHHAQRLAGVILHAPVGAHLGSRLFPRLMALPGARALGKAAIASRLLRPLWVRRFFTAPVEREFTDRFFDEYRTCTAFGLMFDLITPEWFASLRPATVPAALVWGGRERVLDRSHIDQFTPLFDDPIVQIEEDWDHFPMVDTPERYAQVMDGLARRLAGAA